MVATGVFLLILVFSCWLFSLLPPGCCWSCLFGCFGCCLSLVTTGFVYFCCFFMLIVLVDWLLLVFFVNTVFGCWLFLSALLVCVGRACFICLLLVTGYYWFCLILLVIFLLVAPVV